MAVVGFVPAAGRGVRFGGAGYAKELFPLLLGDDSSLRPRPICELSLEAVRLGGATRCIVLIAPDKTEIARVLGYGEALPIAYVVQPEPRGLPEAVTRAAPWLGDDDVLMALPDTVVLPRDALAQVHALRLERGADLALGVFPVAEPERLGPVVIEPDGTVARIFDKPAQPPARNSWGIASWSPRFTHFCIDWHRAHATATEQPIGHVFEAARNAGLPVVAREFGGGKFLDIGTPLGLRTALRSLADEGLVEAAQSQPVDWRRER
jgi:glucose-1-phosphate thymidylyltransferase